MLHRGLEGTGKRRVSDQQRAWVPFAPLVIIRSHCHLQQQCESKLAALTHRILMKKNYIFSWKDSAAAVRGNQRHPQ